jgi:hypothetical protein
MCIFSDITVHFLWLRTDRASSSIARRNDRATANPIFVGQMQDARFELVVTGLARSNPEKKRVERF